MAILSDERIKLHADAASKEDAIRQCGKLLVDTGCVEPGYVDGMLEREKTMSTYMGNGIAIPHGQFDNRSQIRQTGISVLQLAEGVEWEPGETAYLVIGIAAMKDEHVAVLANLAEAVEDQDTAELLSRTNQKKVLLDYLNRQTVEQ